MLIDRFVRFLLPRQVQFFTLLEEIAEKISASAHIFGELESASTSDQLVAIATRLKPLETEADHLCHRLYHELDRTSVTPIDQEDIAALTSALDNVIDEMEHTAAFAALYRFDRLTDPMRNLVRINVEAAVELAKSVSSLRNFGDPKSIRQVTINVHSLENAADSIFREAIAELFTADLMTTDLIRQKDMLECLENGVDRCEDAMDVIRSVVVKNG